MPSRVTKKLDTRDDPSQPLSPQREAFCAAICKGAKLQEAHGGAGFKGSSHAAAWQLRHTPEVDARIRWLLKERVKADERTFARRQKMKGDLLERAIKELEKIAFSDIGETLAWRNEAVTNASGEVTGVRETLALRDSSSMPAEARAAVKSLFMKGDRIRLEMHDKRLALEGPIKALKGDDVATKPNVTVNQLNLGQMGALEVAQRVAFLLAVAGNGLPVNALSQPTIDAKPSPSSTDAESEERP
jgi:hypothetical protein